MPCESACQISTRASSIGAPSPSRACPRTRIREPRASSSVRIFSPPWSNPKAKNGPTVWLGVCLLEGTELGAFMRGYPRARQDDVEAEAEGPLRDGNVVGIVGDQTLAGLLIGGAVVDGVQGKKRIAPGGHMQPP